MKECIKCGCQKEMTEYHKNPSAKGGLKNTCKSCIKDYQQTPRVMEIKRAAQIKYAHSLKGQATAVGLEPRSRLAGRGDFGRRAYAPRAWDQPTTSRKRLGSRELRQQVAGPNCRAAGVPQWASRCCARLPRELGLYMRFLSVSSQVCRQLPPDPDLHRRPCFWLVVNVM